jgi:AcrR family transcriptional regulator
VSERRFQPRREPRQPRAVDTRARILDAARTVFAGHGYAAGTTNRIAAAADLSVGSLYQYFPNKDAILVALVREHVEAGTSAVMAALAATPAARAAGEREGPARAAGEPEGLGDRDPDDLAGTVRRVVAAMVAVHARDRRLHQVLFEEAPRPASLLRELHRLEDEVVALVAGHLRLQRPHLEDPVLSARIIVCAIESLVHRLVATTRPLDGQRFIDEVSRLVVGYLTPDPAALAAVPE